MVQLVKYSFDLCAKVPRDASVREAGKPNKAHVDSALNEVKQQDTQEKSIIKRDVQLSHDQANVEYKLVESDKKEAIAKEDISVSKTPGNQTNSQEKGLDGSKNKELSGSVQHTLGERTLFGSKNRTVKEDSHKMESSVKIRDLKSNGKLKGRHVSSLSSKSFRTFLSKQNPRRSRRSNLQVRSVEL